LYQAGLLERSSAQAPTTITDMVTPGSDIQWALLTGA